MCYVFGGMYMTHVVGTGNEFIRGVTKLGLFRGVAVRKV
jgi:hypothetical protein